ncbi:MAG: TIGR03756 family integrating conjugative element protein [Saezia sp.]
MKLKRLTAILFTFAALSSAHALGTLNSATIAASAASPDCFSYRIKGICYWLNCSWRGCRIRTSIKVEHYIPDVVVSSYSNTGQNPWIEVSPLSAPLPGVAFSGGDGVTSQANENDVAKFKNVDVIGHPGAEIFSEFIASAGYTCKGTGQMLFPYFLSTLDTVGWRHNIPETVYPEALIPGMREIGSRTSLNLWGNVYPRSGFTHQADDYKGSAIAAQRAGDIVTRKAQPHVYLPVLASPRDGYWPAGALVENNRRTGKWQELTPSPSTSCNVFPDSNITHTQAKDGGYAWALWRPYSCCQKRGQKFLGSTNF